MSGVFQRRLVGFIIERIDSEGVKYCMPASETECCKESGCECLTSGGEPSMGDFTQVEPGAYSFIAPCTGCFLIEMWGSGAGGLCTYISSGGSGGGGGGYSMSRIDLVEGQEYFYRVAKGGDCDEDGEDSVFGFETPTETSGVVTTTTLMIARGGNVDEAGSIGHGGGSPSFGDNLGDITYKGGDGDFGAPEVEGYRGGGGGGAAGNMADGNNAVDHNGGIGGATGGGDGGDGGLADESPIGQDGQFPGGGAGGGFYAGPGGVGSGPCHGGKGANGQVRIKWPAPNTWPEL